MRRRGIRGRVGAAGGTERYHLQIGPVAKRFGSTFVGLCKSYGRLRGKLFSKLAAGAFASFGARSVLEPPIRLGGEHRIAIGDDVFIGGGSWLLTVGEGAVALTIGSGTRISGACVISARSSVRIGREVLFARNVYVSDHGHGHDDPSRAIVKQGITEPRPVEIADGAWLGDAVVCPGVSIGREPSSAPTPSSSPTYPNTRLRSAFRHVWSAF